MRSTYQDLTDYDFSVAGVPLRFQSVGDFGAAAVQRNLADNEDAFSVVFTGPASGAIGTGPQIVKNSQIGDFTALVVPVEGDTSPQRYELVVNRILNATDTHYRPPKVAPPTPPPSRPPAPAVSTAPVVSPQTATKKTHHSPAVRKITALRTRTGVRFTLLLKPGAHVRDVTGWLKREEKLLGATSRSVKSNKLAFNVKLGKQAAQGHVRARPADDRPRRRSGHRAPSRQAALELDLVDDPLALLGVLGRRSSSP